MSVLRRSITALSVLALVSVELAAAEGRDVQAVLIETTYRVGQGNTGEVIRHERWKALTSQGRTHISKIQIPYVAAFQDVEFKFVKTLKKDGTVFEGDPSTAFDTTVTSDAGPLAFDDSKYKTILPPSPETGDSIEYEAIIHVHKWAKTDEFWFEHFLSLDVPVLSEKVVLDLPANRKVTFSENGAVAGKTEIVDGRRIERWVHANPEPTTRGLESTRPLFAVSSILSWDAFGTWVGSLNEKPTDPSPEIVALAQKLTAQKSTEQERIAALYAFVATKVRYVALSFGLGRLQPHTASAVLHNAYGDCKDQTALLSALLRASGFKAYAVLTTPGAGVLVREVPGPDQFRHEFAAVDTKAGLLFLDTSMGPVAPGVLAMGIRGRSALLVGEKGASLIDIPAKGPVPNKVKYELKGKVTAAGAFEGSVRFEFQGAMEVGMRRGFADSSDSEKENLLRMFAGPQFQKAKIRRILSADVEDLAKPCWVQCELSDAEFFAPALRSMRIGLGFNAPTAMAFEALKKPGEPVPTESVSASESFDLIIDPALTTENGMPVHKKTEFGQVDAEFTYEKGHLMLAHSFDLNGTAITPQNWGAFIEFLRSAEAETTRSFGLERHGNSAPTTLSPLSQALRDGSAAYQRRDYEGAKSAYLEATKLDTRNTSEAWNSLGRAYAALHAYDDAERAYKRQIELHPRDLYAYNNLGVTYRWMKRGDEAMECFRKQIAINPKDNFAHDNLSISLAAMNQWEEARKESEIAVELSPDDVPRRVRLGRAQVKTGHIDEAAKNFDLVLGRPHDAMTENNIAYYMTQGGMDLDRAWKLVSGTLDSEARLSCHPEKLVEEEKCAAQLMRLAYMLDTAGWVLFRQGKIAESEPYLASSVAISPRAETEIHFSTLLAKMGRSQESLRWLADASSLADFGRVDSKEVRGLLATALGGEVELDSRWKEMRAAKAAPERVLALVDEKGKVLEARPLDPQAPATLIAGAESLNMIPISWPEHSIRSIRTIEFQQVGGKWSSVRSYVGQAAEPAANGVN